MFIEYLEQKTMRTNLKKKKKSGVPKIYGKTSKKNDANLFWGQKTQSRLTNKNY